MLVSEIGVAIKGMGLTSDRKKYVGSERPLTRLHGALNQTERDIVFDIYQEYNRIISEEYEVLDADDVAITLLAHLKTPLWEIKRKKFGFDFVFVDETQLFDQNERQLFRLLTKRSSGNLPIALALDQAQELRGALSTGIGLLGIEGVASETLTTVHRCTPSILKLAFFVIQRTTDLFTPEFPDFTRHTTTVVAEDHPLAKVPRLIMREESASLGKTILREVRSLRRNLRQIAVVIHPEKYWPEILKVLTSQDLPLVVFTRRGESVVSNTPVVVLTKPDNVGGQEFDAVISVGLEYGVVPPLVEGHIGLSEALEQQSLREMYLVFTRARYQLIIINSKHSTPTHTIKLAIESQLVVVDEA
jgi:superfamily I DNA/RNA helicase